MVIDVKGIRNLFHFGGSVHIRYTVAIYFSIYYFRFFIIIFCFVFITFRYFFFLLSYFRLLLNIYLWIPFCREENLLMLLKSAGEKKLLRELHT